MDKKHLLKIAGWLLLFLACLVPIYTEWAMNNGPEWLSQDSAFMTSGLIALLLLWTGLKLMKE